ncbi:MAG: nucleotidyl transferase AbiEii/AbiGii toxin family protein [Proteobacteria bacterium]|nr:MAG: nucleotidyl transferase AbiEii/AbiGii toxin family protein [Pseudomonadota bacterium]
MIKEWLSQYNPTTNAQAEQALREIMQKIALYGLQQAGFFEVAAFYGGTALRIFYGLPRFSEDLDFSLLKPNHGFSFQPYLEGMVHQLQALGMNVEVKEKEKAAKTNAGSAFLKADTEWKELVLKDVIPQERLGMRPGIRIKLEVDTKPPQGFSTEQKLLLKLTSFYVSLFTLPDLFAGKMHAILFRKWKNRVKGRDWFDLEWYLRRGTPFHLQHLEMRARDSGNWNEKPMTESDVLILLHNKIDEVSLEKIRQDVVPFIPDVKVLEIWSTTYFHDLVGTIKFI